MVNMKLFGATALSLLSATEVMAHPGHNHKAEAVQRRAAVSNMSKRSLSHCQDKLAARGVEAKNVQRRHAMHQQLRKTALAKRDFDTVLNTTHHSDLTGITPSTDPATLFVGNNSCILAPETTEGPYYVVGELFRSNVTDDMAGVPLYMDIQLIDTNTCEPLPGVALDFWHCNATGVYSGVSASGNGNSDSDTSNLNATYGRGIQATDSDGSLQFQSIFPGHYTGRTTHIHIAAHPAGTWSLLPNGTITGGDSTAHVGQLFFDQDLIYAVEAEAPYSSNEQTLTLNEEDSIMEGEAEEVDPVAEYVLLGDSVADGIFSWIAVGIDPTANYTVSPAAYYSANGGYANADGPGAGGAPPSEASASA
ncbi:Intradiol ring-cleavage dioxygenase [Lasiodiplodia theobromae]|uniref:Intradiol ring-cleavage dioxygenase n=1 Tax=Lasiodiplodia theobromae TaxID=45133 RepID=UPI0015C341B1|nr:Intradiol ring-cleavage dioxygenase [Lasiodiplodia theobromae]KAF4545857.1 Intradiol ring-cleavage dioxygenase [Lasiodiplodia theobromae]